MARLISALRTKIGVGFLHSLRGKLLLSFLAVALVPLLAVGGLTYIQARNVLSAEFNRKLVAVRDVKAAEIENYFDERLKDVQVLSMNPMIVDAMRSFNQAIASDMQTMAVDESGVMEHYIALYQNRPNLSDAEDGSGYSATHAQLHPRLQKFVELYGYYDLFLIDVRSGVIEYTVAKSDDYGTSLKRGSYANSILGNAFRMAASSNDPSFAMLTDFAPYGPAQLPAAFAVSPIFDGDKMIGVLAFQLPIDQINTVMQSHEGLGDTGQTYLIGPDKVMRSDSRFRQESTILTQKIDTPAANHALSGETAVEEITNYLGVPVLSAYKPLRISGLDWAIMAEVSQTEILAPVKQLGKMILWSVGIVGILVVGLGLLISQFLTAPILTIAQAAQHLATGDAALGGMSQAKVGAINNRRDEMGVVGRAFSDLVGYFTEMASVAQFIAEGNLAVEVNPRAEEDLFGNAFKHMLVNLRRLVQQVSDATENIKDASRQLAATSSQSGQATQQVAMTIQQVAQGSAEQAAGMNRATNTLQQVVRAVEGVAQGAQEQSAAATRTNEQVARLTDIIEQVARSAQASATGSAEAARVAQGGAVTIKKVEGGMGNIRTSVEALAQRINQMGQRSEEIGAIVETIDDIAAQTNLLALNAAIEAARAGEHGKGFAVVADEVRKLAEKSATATREIAGLIQGIQQAVAEAVAAMKTGNAAVDTGTAQVDEAGQALANILQTVTRVERQVADITTAAGQMNTAATELVEGMEAVSAVIEENTAATQEMAASAANVMEAIESVAGVSEENNAAVEEVSAAAEEMNAQVAEAVSATHTLNDAADDLVNAVAKFHVQRGTEFLKQVKLFRQAHLDWVTQVKAMLNGTLHLKGEDIKDYTACTLGAWYYGQGQQDFGDWSEFLALEAPHMELHRQVHELVQIFNQGDHTSAETALPEIERLSQEIVATLNALEQRIQLELVERKTENAI